MKWLSKLSKCFSDQCGRTGGGRHGSNNPQLIGNENIDWRIPSRSLDDQFKAQNEKDEPEMPNALSLSEDLRKPFGRRWLRDHDEELDMGVNDR
ncbi:hypothetical protein PanWU01x14_337690 [Parasponia andersonii]|uniref:Uncharacterized protein n=1 Tax=Parasponia andersonii TaxID=3476 RepID=A0A2P5AFI2_PARAD|nr:hypothetical protein PanWU01x14_337690 [Parasponia andersonii]